MLTKPKRAMLFTTALALMLVIAGTISADPVGTWLVSVDSDGNPANHWSYDPTISVDGRYVAFTSAASNLVVGDTNGDYDIFVHDLETGETTRESVKSDGSQAYGNSYDAVFSSDNRYLVIATEASLVSEDTNGDFDIYVIDREIRETTRVSVHSDGGQANHNSRYPAVSGDGRYVAFYSDASNLVDDDNNGYRDVFIHDRETGETTPLSVDSYGNEGNNLSQCPSISVEGCYVAFESSASNLVPDDTNSARDIFVYNCGTGQLTRVSVDKDGNQGNHASNYPAISADGRFVAFGSLASNLVPDDTNGFKDIFVHDRQEGEITRVSVDSDGNEGNGNIVFESALSADAHYVTFASAASNLVPGDTNNALDTFVHDCVTGQTARVSVDSDGNQGDDSSIHPAINANGRYVAFQSDATNLAPGDTNDTTDIFVHDRGELTIEISIDIKPGDDRNFISLKSKRAIPVAILSTETFDAQTVDSSTVRFGKTGTEARSPIATLEDVDGDGDTDMLLNFKPQDTGIECRDNRAYLTGQTFLGQSFEGSDSIKTVACK